MKKHIFIFFIVMFSSCTAIPRLLSIKPAGFDYKFDDDYTGIDTLININGYYQGKAIGSVLNGCSFMFYDNGIACQTISPPTVAFQKKKSYASWGSYVIEGDSIKVQIVYDIGLLDNITTRNFAFKIQCSDQLILKEYEYFEIQNDDEVIHKKDDYVVKFYLLENRLDFKLNPWLKKGWFWKKGAKKE